MLRLALLLCALAAAYGDGLRAGAAKITITPDLSRGPVYIAGFGRNRVATGIHDDLWFRCLAMEAGKTLVVCAADSIGLFMDDVQKIRDQAIERLGQPADIVVAATHDHEGPDTMGLWGPALGKSGINDEYNLYLVDRAADTIAAAVKSMRPARIRLAKVKNAELDSYVHDTRPPVVLDTELIAMAVEDADGKRIATLVNWANHPETVGSKNTLVTADYPGYLYARLEKLAGGTAIFVNGAIGGMMSPLGAKVVDPKTRREAAEESFRKAEIIGTRVAELAHEALRGAPPARVERVDFKEEQIEIPVTNQGYHIAAKAGVFKNRKAFTEQGGTRTAAGFFRLASAEQAVLECALVPGELYPELSVGGIERLEGADFPAAPEEPAIKKMMRAPFRMLVGLADDEIGYIIPKAEWDEREPWLKGAAKRWYGEVNSVGPEAAPRITAALKALLASAASEPRP